MAEKSRGLYLMHISLHGLIRGYDMELGRDADTGGQITYVVELAKKLSNHVAIDRVDLVTRRVEGKGVDPSYAQTVEPLGERSSILRIPFGPRRYLRKENYGLTLIPSSIKCFITHASSAASLTLSTPTTLMQAMRVPSLHARLEFPFSLPVTLLGE